MSVSVIGGIEGGATHSFIVLLDSKGTILAAAEGPGTNHHLLGIKDCVKKLAELVDNGKNVAGLPLTTPLLALGLSLSGCEDEESNKLLIKELQESYPNVSEKYAIGSDTEGSIASTSKSGGITCIAGTGSNTLLINPDGTRVQCGGWGNLLGDEGSAWSISHRAVKICFDDLDNFSKSPYPITKVWQLIKDHFNIKAQTELLGEFYGQFDKARISKICKKISLLAREGDELSLELFRKAGHDLATSISAVVPKAAPELVNVPGGVHVLCIGSVWLSWDLLKAGFIDVLDKNENIKEMSLMRLTGEPGVGAALMASDRLNLELYRDYSKNYNIVYHYEKLGNCVCKAKK